MKNIRKIIWQDTIRKMSFEPIMSSPTIKLTTKDLEEKWMEEKDGDGDGNEMKDAHREIIEIIDNDSLSTIPEYLLNEDDVQMHRIAILNFANPDRPALGEPIHGTQEEDIMLRTNLGKALYKDVFEGNLNGKDEFYPIKRNEIIYTSHINMYKNLKGEDYNKDISGFNIITACALIYPIQIDNRYKYNKDRVSMTTIIDNIFKLAILNGNQYLVLGAFGCGAFNCPIKETAHILFTKSIEYSAYFKKIIFPIPKWYDDGETYNIFKTEAELLLRTSFG